MTTLTFKTVDTSTLCSGRGGVSLPIVPMGTKVTLTVGGETIQFVSGWSTRYQLCTMKGQGLALHNLLVKALASRLNPVECTISIGEEVAVQWPQIIL